MKILGHRGCVKESPYQNSLKAYELGLLHTNGIEVDACLSLDNQVFLMHETKGIKDKVVYCADEHLCKESIQALNGRQLCELTLEEIKELRLKDGQAIPTLNECLELLKSHPNKKLNIELKGKNVAPAVIRVLKNAIKSNIINEEQLILSSFNHQILFEVRFALPNVAIGLLCTRRIEEAKMRLYPWSNDKTCYAPILHLVKHAEHLKRLKPKFIIIPHTALDMAFKENIISLFTDCKLIVWEFSELNEHANLRLVAQKEKYKEQIAAIIIDDVTK